LTNYTTDMRALEHFRDSFTDIYMSWNFTKASRLVLAISKSHY